MKGSDDIKPKPFGVLQIVAVAELVCGRQKNHGSIVDAEDILKRTERAPQEDAHRKPVD